MSENTGQTIISEDMIFMNIMKKLPHSNDGTEIMRFESKWSRNIQSILKFFQRMRDYDNPIWYYLDHSYIKRTIVSYTRENGSKCYSTLTVGIVFQIQYMGKITQIEEKLQNFKRIIAGFNAKYDNMKFEIFFGMALDDYDIQTK